MLTRSDLFIILRRRLGRWRATSARTPERDTLHLVRGGGLIPLGLAPRPTCRANPELLTFFAKITGRR